VEAKWGKLSLKPVPVHWEVVPRGKCSFAWGGNFSACYGEAHTFSQRGHSSEDMLSLFSLTKDSQLKTRRPIPPLIWGALSNRRHCGISSRLDFEACRFVRVSSSSWEGTGVLLLPKSMSYSLPISSAPPRTRTKEKGRNSQATSSHNGSSSYRSLKQVTAIGNKLPQLETSWKEVTPVGNKLPHFEIRYPIWKQVTPFGKE
jgi:hypothetical protein